jgi:2-methylisocitrate lyase-like PEP mutase family enzyme
VRFFGERLPHPLVTILKPGGLASLGMSLKDLASCGFKLLIDPATPALAAYEAMKKVYAELAEPGFAIRSRPQEDFTRLQKEQQTSIDMDKLIEIERRTTEKPA